jgi:hypothetical protein
MRLIRGIVTLASLEHSSLRSSCPKYTHAPIPFLLNLYKCPKKRRVLHNSLIYRRSLTIYRYTKLNGCENNQQNGLINSCIAPRASMVNCQNIFFSNANTYFFLIILIEIFILKTTMNHKYTLTQKKRVKKRYYRLCAPFCTKHWRHLCPIPIYYLSFVFPANLIWFNLEALRAIREFIKPFCSIFTTI